ncbi:hypothetical protein DPMN_063995 [Dreissena polymorpha]|uniref:Uncharacterized protein n=1 Tax=Dreissena polymorpha TaxID=45954 RepID=A0A9D4CCN0_DREPO|nr:hypothetical protein DPMN_063995 [Dreissena polymorpha]
MHDTDLCTQVSPINAPHILHFRKHKTKSYYWPARTPLCVSQKTKDGFVLIRHQVRLIVQDCASGNATGSSPSGLSEEKLYGQCNRASVLLLMR